MTKYIDADNLINELSAACMPIYEKGITGILGDNSSIADTIMTAYVVDPETIGQYTGLTDTNGNKIFERDLCLCDRNISKHIDKKVFEIKFDPEAGFFGESDTSNIYPSDFYMCEIIGNVFDTPEFLKAGEMP